MNNVNHVKKYYALFNDFRSTAFIVPILYIYLENQLSLGLESIIKIASFYILIPFFIEVPLGYLGDKIGNKKIIQFGLIAQILSCLALLVIKGNLSYHIYLLSIYVAAASYSGADKALINPYFKDSNEFKNYLIKINGELYRNSTVFLIIGALLYQLDPKLPLVIQIAGFLVSFVGVSMISENKIVPHSEINPIKDVKVISNFFKENPTYLLLALQVAVFSTAVALNHKSIQNSLNSSLEHFLSGSYQLFLGLSYVIGNMASYQGSKLFMNSGLKNKNLVIQLTYISLLGLVSFFLMAYSHFVFIFIGFIFLNVFKALFRPVLNAELSSRFPIACLKASALSIVSVLGAIISSLMHYSLAPFFHSSLFGNLIICLFMAIVSLITLYLIRKDLPTILTFTEKNLSGKINQIAQSGQELLFIQNYPAECDLKLFAPLIENKIYPHPMQYIRNKDQLISNYLEGKTLNHISSPNLIVADLLEKRNELTLLGFQSPVACPNEIFNDRLAPALVQKLSSSEYWGNIHGDLHPQNVIVCDNIPYVIDWDLAGEGYIWFDYLTLLTHPWLNFDNVQRIELFKKYFDEFNLNEIERIFHAFRNYKSQQVKGFANVDKRMHELSSLYAKPLEACI